MVKFKLSKNLMNGPFLIPLLCIGSVIAVAAISLGAAFIVSGLENPRDGINLSVPIILVVSGMISGFLSEKISGNIQTGLTVPGIVGILTVLFGLAFGNIAGAFMNAVCYTGAGMLSSVLAKSLGGKKRHRR